MATHAAMLALNAHRIRVQVQYSTILHMSWARRLLRRHRGPASKQSIEGGVFSPAFSPARLSARSPPHCTLPPRKTENVQCGVRGTSKRWGRRLQHPPRLRGGDILGLKDSNSGICGFLDWVALADMTE